jgi:hypothetical protein
MSFSRMIGQMFRHIESFGTQEWLLVLAGVILVGIVCLRGFGSRSNY